MKKNEGFTLIELIAVLVILALIALIVTPLVMNIVKKSKQSANERSIDAYGKSLELSVASYLLEHKEYPTRLEGLKVEYTGSEVVCSIKILNKDGSIYLSECSVSGMEVKDASTEDGWYHYGKSSNKDVTYQVYNIGDVVTYNGMEFYVIEASDENSDIVTMLKAEPLTVDEVNKYGVGHINRYASHSIDIALGRNGYGLMAYYTSETCGKINGSWIYDGCTTDYNESEVKYVVGAWANDKLNVSDLKEDSLGYKTRLLTVDDLVNNLGYSMKTGETTYTSTVDVTPSWVYSGSGNYWTMSAWKDSVCYVWTVHNNGGIFPGVVDDDIGIVVRPVITLSKDAI